MLTNEERIDNLEKRVQELSEAIARLSTAAAPFLPIGDPVVPRTTPVTPPITPIFPSVPIPRNCSKCGIELTGVMSYCCPKADCPTGLGSPMC